MQTNCTLQREFRNFSGESMVLYKRYVLYVPNMSWIFYALLFEVETLLRRTSSTHLTIVANVGHRESESHPNWGVRPVIIVIVMIFVRINRKGIIMSCSSWPFGQDNSPTTFMTKHRGCRFLPPEEQYFPKGGHLGGGWRSALHEEHFCSMQITERVWFETLSLFNRSMFIKYD